MSSSSNPTYQPYITPAQRKRLQSERATATVSTTTAVAPPAPSQPPPSRPTESLVEQVRKMRREEELNPEETARRKREEEEARVLQSVKLASAQALVSTREKKGDESAKRTSPVRGWRPTNIPSQDDITESRRKHAVGVSGENPPPMLSSFQDMNLPVSIMAYLAGKGINTPTSIQMQGLPVIMYGRDAILVASTGSGKTLSFAIPAVVVALEQHSQVQRGMGPLVLCLGPSRELQRQTYEVLMEVCGQDSRVNCALAIGGENKLDQVRRHKERGTHILVGTPGRINDFMMQGEFSMSMCNLIVLDEGDRMLDSGFDEEVRKIMGRAIDTRQTIMFSATMPRKVTEFAMEAMLNPIVVNVGRPGGASSNITQRFKLIKFDDRFVSMLDILKKTGPPVLIFASRSGDVDDVEEYLLLKGVRAVGIHGGRTQEERNSAVDRFKSGEKEVLVASDIAAKGLDFPAISHVINFDTPPDVETYVHRIGRTGRGGKKGLATTCVMDKFFHGNETFFMDLVAVLRDAKQEIPSFFEEHGIYVPPPPALQAIEVGTSSSSSSARAAGGGTDDVDGACPVCGGYGHRITACPKVREQAKKNVGASRDLVSGSNF